MNDGKPPLKIYVIAGEASGDFLGSHLMESLAKISPRPVKFFGIGGARMEAQGITSLFPYHELSLLGFVEVVPHYMNVLARINATVEDILSKQPDVVVTIDAPGFCYRVVERLRIAGSTAKFVHYVAPTVWAYKPERAQRFAKFFDHILVLLPFEPPYFENAGLPTTFVGHTVVAETSQGSADAFRAKYQIAPNAPIFSLFPGSRRGEIARHMPVFGRAMTMLSSLYPNMVLAVPLPVHLLETIAPYFEGCPFRAVITGNEEDKKNALAASQLAIVKSGTVALEVGLSGTPMIVGYRVNPLSAWMLKRILLTKYVNLINILSHREVIPELLQELCTPLMLASAAATLLDTPERREMQKADARAALQSLLPPCGSRPSDLAACKILEIISK